MWKCEGLDGVMVIVNNIFFIYKIMYVKFICILIDKLVLDFFYV